MKAFPQTCLNIQDNYTVPEEEGMDLRDYFAAKAMQACLTEYDSRLAIKELAFKKDISPFEVTAMQSYEIADAMMEARKNTKEK